MCHSPCGFVTKRFIGVQNNKRSIILFFRYYCDNIDSNCRFSTLTVNDHCTDLDNIHHSKMSLLELPQSKYPSTRIFSFDEVASTQDEAKAMVKSSTNSGGSLKTSFAVVAAHQSKGRGSKGRTWVSGTNNLYMTVVLKMSRIPIPITLVPLRIGTIVRESICSFLPAVSLIADQSTTSSTTPLLKWPNDVLIGGKKVSGVLMEIEDGNIYIGIGCNVSSAPVVLAVAGDGGCARESTCLTAYITSRDHDDSSCARNSNFGGVSGSGNVDSSSSPPLHQQLAVTIVQRIDEWLLNDTGMIDSAARVVSDFTQHMDKSIQYLRIDDGVSSSTATSADAGTCGSGTGAGVKEAVIPLYVHLDGTLQVRSTDESVEKTLVAEYLW